VIIACMVKGVIIACVSLLPRNLRWQIAAVDLIISQTLLAKYRDLNSLRTRGDLIFRFFDATGAF